jgi:hypothetical protein
MAAFILIIPAAIISGLTTATTKHNNEDDDDDYDDNNNNNNNPYHLLRQAGLSAALCLVGRYKSSKVQWDVSLKHAGMEVQRTGICIYRQY